MEGARSQLNQARAMLCPLFAEDKPTCSASRGTEQGAGVTSSPKAWQDESLSPALAAVSHMALAAGAACWGHLRGSRKGLGRSRFCLLLFADFCRVC